MELSVETTFDHEKSYFKPDYCPRVLITYEATYDVEWTVKAIDIISIEEIAPQGSNREIQLSTIDSQDMKWAKYIAKADAQDRWREAKEHEILEKADSDRDFEISG